MFISKYGQLFHLLLLASQPLASTTSLGSRTTLGLNQPEMVAASQSPAACTEYSSASSGGTTTSARDHCHLCWGLQSHLLEIIIMCWEPYSCPPGTVVTSAGDHSRCLLGTIAISTEYHL